MDFSKCIDDDSRPKRTGTVWTASSHIITAVIGSGVLSLAWAMAQLGWAGGPVIMIYSPWSFFTRPISSLLAIGLIGQEVRSLVKGITLTYMDAQVQFRYCQSLLFHPFKAISELNFQAARKKRAYQRKRHRHKHRKGDGSSKSVEKPPSFRRHRLCLLILIILIEIQDTVKSPPVEHKTMKKATLSLISVVMTIVFYMCGCMGYAAGFAESYWLLDIANLAIVIHLVGAYQVYCQPLFAFVEKWSAQRWPKISLITNGRNICLPLFGSYNFILFRLISMLMPFFNDVLWILGAVSFWPLTVYFPIEMYINQKKKSKWSNRWLGLQILSFACLLVSVAAACGSIAGVFLDLKSYKPFKSND